MNTENCDIEEIRKAWIAMGNSLGMSSPAGGNPEDLNKKKTALDRLRDRYRVFWTVSLVMAFVWFMIFSRGMIVESDLNFWLGVAYAAYFLICFAMDYWLYCGIGSIDPLRMTVSQVVDKSVYYKKWHLKFVAVLIPVAIFLLGFTGYVFSADKYMLEGMAVGAICGLIIGIMQFRRFMEEYRKLSE